MDHQDAPRRASFGASVLVTLGWVVTVVAAMLVGWAGLPVAPDRDCSAMFSCMTPQQEFGLLVVVGAPVIAVLALLSLLLTALLARRVPSSILVGTVAPLAAGAVAGLVAAVWNGAR